MRHIFDDEEEKIFVEGFIAKNLNEQIDKIAEEKGIDQTLEITSKMIIETINLYEK